MSARRDDLAYLVGIALGLAILIGAGFVAVREAHTGSNDWAELWAGPRVFLAGLDPYDPARWRIDAPRFQQRVPITSVYGYPGWALVALLPLGALPLELGGWIWTIGGMVAGIVGLRALLRAFAPGLPAVHTLAGLSITASEPAITTFYTGQWGWILIALVSSSLVALRTRRATVAGLAFAAAALAKPQLFILAAPSLGRAALRRGMPRALAAFVACCAAAVVVSLAVLPQWAGAYLAVVNGRLPTQPLATTLPSALADLAGTPGLLVAVAAVVALVLLTLAFDPRSDAFTAVALATSLVVAPYVWSYDQLLLVVPFVVAAGIVGRRGAMRGALLMAACAVLLLIVATVLHAAFNEARMSESYNGVIPATAAALLAAALWPHRREAA